MAEETTIAMNLSESESWQSGNQSDEADENDSICKYILYADLGGSRVRIWDMLIFVPNVIFLIFLCIRFKRARLRLYATNSPIFLTFYGIIWTCVTLSIVRCLASMFMAALDVETATEVVADKIMWTVVRFALLTTEMSVLIFGMAFGHLDSRNSIRAVLTTTCLISLVFSITQGTLELLLPNDSFHIKVKNLDLFGHGGILFLLITSIFFSITYLIIFLLPYTRVRNLISLPMKRSFYHYILTLFLWSFLQIIGCVIVLSGFLFSNTGLCLINFVHYLYFTLYIPLVYFIFLNDFCYQSTKIPFSYAANDNGDDQFNSVDSANTLVDDEEFHFNVNQARDSGALHSNNFILNEPMGAKEANLNYHKFLYATAVQSPDSITGYSSVEESTATTSPHGGSMEFVNNAGGGAAALK